MNKIDKIFKYSTLINTFCIILPLLFVALSLCFIQISEKISQFCFCLGFFTAFLGSFIYVLTFIIILIVFIISLFRKNKTKKDYIIIFSKFIYIVFLILFTTLILMFDSVL